MDYSTINSAAGYGPFIGSPYRNAFSSNGTVSMPTGIESNTAPVYSFAESGVYSGSLSSQGNMLAMQLAPAEYKTRTDSVTSEIIYEPWLWGWFRLYWEDPRKTTFGSDSAIPALTGVVPDKYNDQIPGNLVYWIDLALCRLSGTLPNQPSFWNNYYFFLIFNQTLGYVVNTNDYIRSINNAEENNLQYYGSNNYTDFVTQGFDVFTKGNALLQALKNVGILVQTIPSGYFGTANSVAKIMLDNGLGFIGNLTQQLQQLGINLADIYNISYTKAIENILSGITSKSDLIVIQGVLESKIPNMQSPLDYTDISRASGLPNDSNFTNMAQTGVKLYEVSRDLTFTTGEALVALLTSLRTDGTGNLSSLSSTTSALNANVIASLRSFLPQTADNQTISMLNMIGTAAGYYTEQLRKVNDAIEALYATQYGSQIRTIMENISKYNAANQAVEQEAEIKSYYALLETISKDTNDNISYLVNTINNNYDFICQQLYFEISNFGKAGFSVIANDYIKYLETLDSPPDADQQVFNFVAALPYYAADPSNLESDNLLYGLAQPNEAGSILKAILVQSKNNQLLGQAGVGFRTF